MSELKFYLLCLMIAAPQGAMGSYSEKFVETRVDNYTYNMNLEQIDRIPSSSGLPSEVCFEAAVFSGAEAVRLISGDCYMDYLVGSVCPKEDGETTVYVQKDYLENGSPNDRAENIVDYYRDSLPDIRYYRIENPTILEFGDLKNDDVPDEEKFEYFATSLDGNTILYSDLPALVDPSCYTTSVCSYLFLTTAPEIPESEFLILYDICGQSFQVDSGKSFYVLSHEGIGCKNFPNDYPEANCWAEFTGAGKITINVTFVNFRESDQCDGFTLTARTDDANGSPASTNLCEATAPTELKSEGGKARIEFGGSASPTREKYGFAIQVSAA